MWARLSRIQVISSDPHNILLAEPAALRGWGDRETKKWEKSEHRRQMMSEERRRGKKKEERIEEVGTGWSFAWRQGWGNEYPSKTSGQLETTTGIFYRGRTWGLSGMCQTLSTIPSVLCFLSMMTCFSQPAKHAQKLIHRKTAAVFFLFFFVNLFFHIIMVS